MDWYLDTAEDAIGLRHQFGQYLARHAVEGADVDGAVLTLSELVNNALEHAGGPVWVSADWTGEQPVLTVRDLGPSFDIDQIPDSAPHESRGRGLAIAADLAQRLEVEAREVAGTAVKAELDVSRKPTRDIDPPRTHTGVLPRMDEAGPGGFGREPFLRALVVQLAQEAERREGPGVAEALVAQAGIDVGGQMEEEFRGATGAEGPLAPQQLADCYVRLKHAIEGDFYPIEVTEKRIVLGNRRCPFGDAVKKAPALCRMTSSVFGGIAARNAGGASVVLEERIAVGDLQCRVVVELGAEATEVSSTSHVYLAPVD